MPQLTHRDKEHLRRLNQEVGRRLAPVFAGFQRDMQEVELEQIRKDPKTHKTTRIMADGKPANWRYLNAGTNSRGSKVRFCRTVYKNAAGYYLFFREVETKGRIVRDQWAARKTKKEVIALVRRRTKQFKDGIT